MHDANKARMAQKEYTERTGSPHFAPMSGACYKCNRNIYEKTSWKIVTGRRIEVLNDSPEAELSTGITVEEASAQLVTGCPHCNRSYCD